MITELTHDNFLNGKIKIWQPKQGYRAATDPVLLAAAIAAKPGNTVLELGCGVGTAIACLCRRLPKISAYGLEIQEEYALLARRNSAENSLELSVHVGDVLSPPEPIRQMNFDEVFLNPPFFERAAVSAPGILAKNIAHIEGAAVLSDWINTAIRRTKPLGHFTIIHRSERLADILEILNPKAGDIRVLPLASRKNRDAARVIIRARKGAKGATRLLAPLILHEGSEHTGDGDNYSDRARNILRHMSCIEM